MINCYIFVNDHSIADRLATLLNGIPKFCTMGISTSSTIGITTLRNIRPDVLFISNNFYSRLSDCPESCTTVTILDELTIEPIISDRLHIHRSLNKDDFMSLIQYIAGKYFLRNLPAPPDFFYLQGSIKGRRNKVCFRDIYFIESVSNYSIINCAVENHLVYYSLKELINWLPSCFRRIHRSYIVNVDFIVAAEGSRVILSSGKEITIGRSYKHGFLSLLDSYTVRPKALVNEDSVCKIVTDRKPLAIQG